MKLIKILTVIAFILILLDGFAYFNILTSEKYEVDLMETYYKVEGISLPQASIEAKKREILTQKKRTKIELTIISIAFITLIGVWVYKRYRSKA